MNTSATIPDLEKKRHLIFLGILVACALLWSKPIAHLTAYSLHHESCSHILLVPFISAYLLYTERKRIFSSVRSSWVVGLPLMFVAAFCYWRSATLSPTDNGNVSLSLAALSLVLVCMGSFVACYGLAASRAAVFPLLFLLFLVPLPDAVLSRTIHLLQQGSAELSFLLFKAAGVPVFRQGFVFTLPGVQIEVAQQCSGIRSSIALVITCLLAGHLFLRTGWRAAILVLVSLPLAIVKNAIRIVTLTVLSIYVNPGFLYGRLHRDGGFVFFLLALALLFPLFRALEKSEGRTARSAEVGSVELGKEPVEG
jgi:exosortase